MSNIYHLHGSHSKIGKSIAKIYKEHGSRFNKPLRVVDSDYIKQLKIYKKFYPKLLEEFYGTADELGIDRDQFIKRNICIYDVMGGCSIFRYGNLIGRNYDWFRGSINYTDIFYVQSDKNNDFIGISDGDYWDEKSDYTIMYDDVINSKFLYIGMMAARSHRQVNGLLWNHYMRLLIERCNNVNDILKLIKKIPLATAKFFFVSDLTKSIVIEHRSGLTYNIIYPENNTLIHTNHWLTPKFIKDRANYLQRINKKSTTIERWDAESTRRYNTIKQGILEYQPKTLAKIKSILDQKYVLSDIKNEMTIWQLLIDMNKKEIICVYRDKKFKLHKLFK
jgi:predicted choloylglycine hydrolase